MSLRVRTALFVSVIALTVVPSGLVRAAGSAPATVKALHASVFADVSPGLHYQKADILGRQDAGEPSVGVDWKTGAVMYMAGTQVSRVTFSPSGRATWKDVTPPQQSIVNEDAILLTDHRTGRTLVEGLLVAGSNGAYTDNDGHSWTQDQGFPTPHGPDHETLGVGPYASPAPATAHATGYPDAIYYCSQNVVTVGGSFCGRSDTGGLSYNPAVKVLGQYTTPCGAITGHIKVSSDGTVYVPQMDCAFSNGRANGQGMAVSRDNGLTWTYSVVPDSKARAANTGTDPSVGTGTKGTVYYGYEDGSGHPKIAVSHDHGTTWSHSVDVGVPFGIKNSKFPEVVVGDDNRAAFAWLGTTTGGDDQSKVFRGTWYLYVSYTYDGGRTWQTVNATPGDPVQRGCIWNGGLSNPCRNLLDFNDATVDKQGRVIVAFTDGCANMNWQYQTATGTIEGLSPHGPSKCDTKANSFKDTDKVSFVGLVRQTCGKGLFAAYDGELPSCGSGIHSGTPHYMRSATG